MEIFQKILISAISLLLLGLGLKSMFNPRSMIQNFSVTPDGAAGLNTMRGVIGGFFLGSFAMLITGLIREETIWFLPVAILLAAVAMGRLIGLVVDGFHKNVVPPLVLEIVMIGFLIWPGI